jgi:hypothetical protein
VLWSLEASQIAVKPLIELSSEQYDALLKDASEISFVHFRLKNAVKTGANTILVLCNVYEAAMLLLVAMQYCPDAVPLIEQAIRLARFPQSVTRFLSFVHPNGISSDRIVKRGSNPNSDQSLPQPFAARSREGDRAWNEFLTNHCGSRQR